MKRAVLAFALMLLVALPFTTFAQSGESEGDVMTADTTVMAPAAHQELIWSIGVFRGDSPWTLKDPDDIKNPVFTYKDITDVNALFVADPFIFKYGNKYLLFMEVAKVEPYGYGDIAYAESDDGINWTYKGVVLHEYFHLSYPQVFESDGEYYMIPETYQTHTLRLYKATNFPTEWKFEKTLVDVQNVDPSIFHEGKYWYIICATDFEHGWDDTRLYYSKDLEGPWKEHPASPIVKDDANISRPAGRIMRVDGHWYRLSQDTYPTYGQSVSAFRIDKITPKVYQETPVSTNPVLQPSGEWWTKEGMHQIDAIQLPNGKWLGVVDGQAYQVHPDVKEPHNFD